MKKALLALSFAALAHFGAAAQGYTFTKSTGTYTALVSPTVVSSSGWQADTAFVVPIGFSFNVAGSSPFTTLLASGFGDLYFTGPSNENIIFGFDGAYFDRGLVVPGAQSPISYLLTGTTGSRILKVEYKDAMIVDLQAQVPYPNETANFQVWLYEGSNKIEVHCGNSTIQHASSAFFGLNGPAVGVATYDPTPQTIDGFFLQGQASAPTLSPVTGATAPINLSSIPTTGTIYAFSPSTATGVSKDMRSTKLSVYPNPATDVVNIEGLTAEKGNVTVKVSDVLGNEVLRQEMPAAAVLQLNVSNLNKGAYFVEINNGTERIGKSIIKQ